MLGYYNYTVILTYIGMLVSFGGIHFALTGQFKSALLCLMISGFCDMFDGKVASTKKDRTLSEKRFGIQIDSLSDLICFGVLPALIVSQAVPDKLFARCVSGAYLLCALIRLAFFNVDEEERQQTTQEPRSVYLGLPVTTSALLLPALFSAARLLDQPLTFAAPVLLAGIGIAFLIPFRLKKPGNLGKGGLILLGAAVLCLTIKAGV